MATEIYIKPYGAESYSRLDLDGSRPMLLNFRLFQPVALKEAKPLQNLLRFPGTKNNRRLFSHLYDPASEDHFHTHKKASVYILHDSLEIFRGVIELKKVLNTVEPADTFFECVLYNPLDDFLLSLGEKQLAALDLSEFDHTYDRPTQEASWPEGDDHGYVYPMINYKGKNLADPLWRVEDFYPAVYVQTYLDRIFADNGYRYRSSFFEGDFFRHLIIPFNRGGYRFSNAEILEREFKALLSSIQEIAASAAAVNTNLLFDNDSLGDGYDPSGLYDETHGIFTVGAGMKALYDIKAFLSLRLRLAPVSTVTLAGSWQQTVLLKLKLLRSGSSIPVDLTSVRFDFVLGVGTVVNPGDLTDAKTTGLNAASVLLNEGDQIYVEAGLLPNPVHHFGSTGGHTYLQVLTDSYFTNRLLHKMVNGMTLNMQNVIPEGIRQKDFFLSLVKMFRLHIEEDKEEPNTLVIEPRDDFFTEEILDWTKKFNQAEVSSVEPVNDLLSRRYNYRYREDFDYYNAIFQDCWRQDGKRRTYGDRMLAWDNDFAQDASLVQPVFSPTVLTGCDDNHRIVPAMYVVDPGGGGKERALNIRILYYGGLKPCEPWLHQDVLQALYPFCGHLDDPFAPTLDLSFGIPAQLFYDNRRYHYSDNNLYNRFHRRAEEEMEEEDTRLLTGRFILSPFDLFRRSFRHSFFIHGIFYRLLEIQGYDLSSSLQESARGNEVQCTFLKVKNSSPFVPSSQPVIGGHDDVVADQSLPAVPDTLSPLPDHSPQVILGTGNQVAATASAVSINGHNNTVGPGASHVSIIGSENTVAGGLTNICLIHTSGMTIEESDVTYLNGCRLSSCGDPGTAIADRSGQAALEGGTVVVTDDRVTTGSIVLLTATSDIAGNLTVAVFPGSFVITSSDPADAGTVNWYLAKS